MLQGNKIALAWSLVAIFSLACFGTVASAATLDELLDKIREQRVNEATIASGREADFRSKRDAQQKLYEDTLALRNAAEARSDALVAEIEANRTLIAELGDLLDINEGNLGELFGVTRQIAGDATGLLADSVVNTQLVYAPGEEDRVAFMRRIAGATALPSIAELERLWYELLEEMQADGQVMRYTAPVLQEDGVTSVDYEVVRIGSFMVFADNKYLAYLPGDDQLVFLERQPVESDLMDSAARILSTDAASGYIPAVVDPARGALLSLFVERPGIIERISKGEVVGWVIVAVGLIGVLVALIQYLYLFIAKFAVSAQLRHLNQPVRNNALGRMLLSVSDIDDRGSAVAVLPQVVELRISESVQREIPRLERFQAFLRLAVAAGPLLGLIGTVIGMIITFESITASGSSDPKLMAEGIGQAMIATVLGLGVAIPLLFLNAGLVSLSRSVINTLEEQSTRLMADRLVHAS